MRADTDRRREAQRVPDVVFAAGGEMRELCRSKDWAATPLGPVEEWPQSLRTLTQVILGSSFPHIILWGPQLVQIYNDGYRRLMGEKHPGGLGQPTYECWPETRERSAPIHKRVLAGEPVTLHDALRPVARYGRLEDAYFTASYSPVRDREGAVTGIIATVFDTTEQVAARGLQAERERLYRELEREQARLEEVFRQAPSFLAILRGPDHVFEMANDAYFKIVGNRDIVGKPVLEALPEVREQGFFNLLHRVLETGEPYVGRETSVMLARTPGDPPEERFVDFVYMPLTEADGTRTGVIAHGYDVTEQVRTRREIERLLEESERARADAEAARAQAESANRAKAQFLASMSHELRTPLNAIAGYVDLLDSGVHGQPTDAQREALARVAANQRHLLMLIEDILSYAQLEAGRIQLELRPLSTREVLSNLEALVAPQARAHSVEYDVEPCGPTVVLLGDEERVRQILRNLIGNAIKFTPEGGWVRLSCEEDASGIKIHVRDNGPGIAPETQQAIFDAFTQVGRRLDRPKEGVGLGLAISRELARSMGGDLTVDSAPGEGSTFTLRLPAVEKP